ncbi:MAG: CdaR family protein [Clostridia bacterium]
MKQKTKLQILAIIMAIGLWVWVSFENNPLEEKVIYLPVEIENLDKGYMLLEAPEQVKVRISGKKDLITEVSSQEFQASVNLADGRAGSNNRTVNIKGPEGIQIVSIKPELAKISLDLIDEIQLPVVVKVNNQLPAGYRIVDTVVRPAEVLIKGASSLLADIAEVVVEATISEGVDFKQNLPLSIHDKNGNNIQDMFKLEQASVDVFIPITKIDGTKELAVKPLLLGTQAVGYEIVSILVEPASVLVNGNMQALLGIDNVYTETINISDAKENIVQEVNLAPLTGNAITKPSSVYVSIEIKKIIK